MLKRRRRQRIEHPCYELLIWAKTFTLLIYYYVYSQQNLYRIIIIASIQALSLIYY